MGRSFLIAAMVFIAGSAIAEEQVAENSIIANVSSGDPVKVSNINGDILVTGGGGNSVEVYWKLTCDTPEEMDAVSVICETENGIDCSVEYDESWSNGHSARVDFHLTVPRETPLEYRIENVNGVVELKDASGSGEIRLVNGDLSASGFSGPLSMELVNGSLNATADGMTGDLSLRTVNGIVRLELNTEASVQLETLSGSIVIPEEYGAVFTDQAVGSSAEFGTGRPVISVSTVSGDIELL